MLNWLGDTGGFQGAIFQAGLVACQALTNIALANVLATQAFKSDSKWQLTFCSAISCAKTDKRRTIMKKANRRIDDELDLVRFVRRQLFAKEAFNILLDSATRNQIRWKSKSLTIASQAVSSDSVCTDDRGFEPVPKADLN